MDPPSLHASSFCGQQVDCHGICLTFKQKPDNNKKRFIQRNCIKHADYLNLHFLKSRRTVHNFDKWRRKSVYQNLSACKSHSFAFCIENDTFVRPTSCLFAVEPFREVREVGHTVHDSRAEPQRRSRVVIIQFAFKVSSSRVSLFGN